MLVSQKHALVDQIKVFNTGSGQQRGIIRDCTTWHKYYVEQ